ncbi:nuclear transport factor 2 family protein [Parasphingopyxis algicola]|uniref:nuclear transport factor 2 family protein n=1 Tax=Parasphingopyxis algicola TaxID=2026624 RepID=UPI0015A21AD3|nr:nuclear transport factor 2 family protein [Parasphingopyxis algicola]QLC25599.1 nuclear transport factor 2 family protein [Parasphingopyxis algicola]
MPLSRNALIDLAVDGYFGNVGRRDIAALLGNMAEDVSMQVPSMGIRFADKQAIADHFDDFLDAYSAVSVDDFIVTADIENQSVAVRFRITLTPSDGGEPRVMRNCNFFEIDAAGRIRAITNYMSGQIEAGFHAGVSR